MFCLPKTAWPPTCLFLVSRSGDAGSTGRAGEEPQRARGSAPGGKGVGAWRQQDGVHGGRNPLQECVTTHLPNGPAPEKDGARIAPAGGGVRAGPERGGEGSALG